MCVLVCVCICVCVCVRGHACECVISFLSPAQLRREKIDLENTLEQEQEMLVNKLWKRMDKVEQEKRYANSSLGGPPCTGYCQQHMWQSHVENEHYSVVYFDCVTVFEVAYLRTSVKGGAQT